MEGTVTGGTPAGPASRDRPFYQRASFWTGPFMLLLGVVVGGVLAVGWYILGGFPRDHNKYGEVAVPGTSVIALPEGDVRLNFENSAHRSGDSTILDDQPPGLTAAVTPAPGGEQLAVDDVPSWLVSFGASPWTPLESKFLGAILVFVAVMLIMLLLTLPFRLMVPREERLWL